MNAVPLRRQHDDTLAELPAADARRGFPSVPPAFAAPQVTGFALVVSERLAALSGRSLLHASPPSVAEVWARHRHAAERFDAGLVRWPRHIWGAGHTAATAVSYLIIAVAFSPAGFALAVILIAAAWFWL